MKKKFTLAFVLLCTANYLFAQNCPTETFSKKTSGWTLSQGAQIRDFDNPANQCQNEYAIITPGVGGNNPCNIKTPAYTSFGSTTIDLSFDIYCLDANLRCNSWKDFDCETSVDVFYYIGNAKYTGITDFVLPPNGPVGNPHVIINVPVGVNLPAGTSYNIEVSFKPKSGIGNCIQQNTKYVIDNFRVCQQIINSFANPSDNIFSKATEATSDFTISPNPSNNSSIVKINKLPVYDNIQLINHSGKICRTINNNSTTSALIDISGLDKGLYIVLLKKRDSGETISKKLIVN